MQEFVVGKRRKRVADGCWTPFLVCFAQQLPSVVRRISVSLLLACLGRVAGKGRANMERAQNLQRAVLH
jgi:hypothetical protein